MTAAKVFDAPVPSAIPDSATRASREVLIAYRTAPTRTITAGGVTYAYRQLGPRGGSP
jgi:hypothetical protein